MAKRKRQAAANALGAAFPSQGIFIDMAGLPVDGTSSVWILNSPLRPTTLDFALLQIHNPVILDATARYMRLLIESRSTDLTRSTFSALMHIKHSDAFVAADGAQIVIQDKFFAEMRSVFGANGAFRLHHIRHWYRACVQIAPKTFSREVSIQLGAMVVGGNTKGQAVLSLDPDEGPLNDLEVTALTNALTAQRHIRTLDLDELAALWMCIAFGSNPGQFALMREEDVTHVKVAGASFGQVKIPRLKKRQTKLREAFRYRKLTQEIGVVIFALIRANRRERRRNGWSSTLHAFPLFVRKAPQPQLLGAPMEEYARHLTTAEFTALVGRALMKLNVISPRTGRPIVMNGRRFRYTFGTRFVQEGGSRRALADALDHTDLQNVGVYFDIKSDIVASLDKATALALAPVAQAFMGNLVSSEKRAERGDDPSSRVALLDRQSGASEGLGTCGQHSYCSLYAPIACYTCAKFQPWMDGPHEKILDELLAMRERRKEADQDARMVEMHNSTILAIADVMTRIEAAKGKTQ